MWLRVYDGCASTIHNLLVLDLECTLMLPLPNRTRCCVMMMVYQSHQGKGIIRGFLALNLWGIEDESGESDEADNAASDDAAGVNIK